MSASNFLESIAKTLNKLFSSSDQSKDNGPIYQIPNDVIAQLFSLLSGNKANLGRTCKWLNDAYLWTTPEALCRSKLLTALEKPAKELVNETFERKIYAKEDSSAQPKLNNFLGIYLEQMKIMNLRPNDYCFGYCTGFAARIIQNCSIETALIIKSLLLFENYIALDTAKATAQYEFNANIFHNMIDSYAKQPIEEITPDSFNKHTNLMRGYFPKSPRDMIKDKLRNAVRKEHDLQKLNAIYEENLNPSADAPRFVAARTALEAKLSDKKTIVIDQLIALAGPTTGNEKTDVTALKAWHQAEREANKAFDTFFNACLHLYATGFDAMTVWEPFSPRNVMAQKLIEAINEAETALKTSSSEQNDTLAKIKELYATYQQKNQDFEKKYKINDFEKKFKIYGLLDELAIIEKDLQPEALDKAVREEMAINAAFYSKVMNQEE